MQDDKFIGEAKPVKDVKVKMKPVSDMMVQLVTSVHRLYDMTISVCVVLCFVIVDTHPISSMFKVAKRVRVDFSQQENGTNSSFSEILPRKSHIKGSVEFFMIPIPVFV